MQAAGTSLAVGMVSISEEFSLQLHGFDSHKCQKLDIVSCIYFLSYSSNIVREVALTNKCIRVKNIAIFVILRRY